MKLRLHLLRHADAGDPGTWTRSDAERPLSAKGEAQARRLGEFLASVGFEADVFVASPKVRARETARLVAEALGRDVRIDERLAAPLDGAVIDGLLGDLGGPRSPVLVGHDPDFSALAGELIGTDSFAMRKGAIARIDLDGPVSAGGGRLRWLVPPDLLLHD